MRLTEEADGLFGFAYFPPRRRAELGLVRIGTDDEREALDGVGDELARSGRVIVAGDGFHLPWHVGAGRHTCPTGSCSPRRATGGELEIADPFACRNELGVQQPTRHAVASGELAGLLPALPGDNPGPHAARAAGARRRHRRRDRPPLPVVRRRRGPASSASRTASTGRGRSRPRAPLRERGQDPSAYLQADDIWSIGRHRAFLVRYAQRLAAERGNAALAPGPRSTGCR